MADRSVPPDGPVARVGRARELDAMRTAHDAALAGQGGLVLIGGEAGIGKTTLAESSCPEPPVTPPDQPGEISGGCRRPRVNSARAARARHWR